jgi:antitoxin ParD1/3/4
MANFAIFCHRYYDVVMAAQTTMNISLPETLRAWVEQCVEADGYGTASEYIRALVRDDQKRRAQEELDRKLLESLDSGPAAEMTTQDWQHIRSTVKKRLQSKKADR